MPIGTNIKRHRQAMGLTQDKLGEKIGVSGKAVSAWELGSKIPRMNSIQRMAEVFGVSKSALVDDYPLSSISPIEYIPILGKVAAGHGCFTDNSIDSYQAVPSDLICPDEQYILLNVKGDSMSPKIEPGDRLLIQLMPSVDSGSYAVIMIDDEDGVVKKVCYSSNRIELISENPYYPPRVFEGSEISRVRVIGLVKYIFRKL